MTSGELDICPFMKFEEPLNAFIITFDATFWWSFGVLLEYSTNNVDIHETHPS